MHFSMNDLTRRVTKRAELDSLAHPRKQTPVTFFSPPPHPSFLFLIKHPPVKLIPINPRRDERTRTSVTYIINRPHFVAPFISASTLFTHFSLRPPTVTSVIDLPPFHVYSTLTLPHESVEKKKKKLLQKVCMIF